jgi:hypothetical protein
MQTPIQQRALIRRLIWPVYVLFLALSVSVTARAQAGIVAFALGESSVARGQAIHVGDVIQTGDNGHVHIRFVDGALVSVRPNSELKVDEYSFFPDEPEKNRVRFTLKSGTVRSVTGEAGRLNTEGYRMNTPISAIGIRGTDYTVFSDETKTRVFVQSGGVGIAPLDEECAAEDVGVCQSSKLVELFAGDSHVIEISVLKHGAVNRSTQQTLEAPAVELGSEFELTTLRLDKAVEIARKTDFGEDEIGWSHWSNYQQVLGDLFKPTVPFLASDWRIVSANSLFGLFLKPQVSDAPRNGTIQYGLDRYEAYLLNGSRIEQASVQDASLSIDFASRQFQFDSTMSSASASDQMSVQGDLSVDGFLRALSNDFKVNGGITSDGAGAGLLFEKTVDETSRFVGASAWSQN